MQLVRYHRPFGLGKPIEVAANEGNQKSAGKSQCRRSHGAGYLEQLELSKNPLMRVQSPMEVREGMLTLVLRLEGADETGLDWNDAA